LFKKSQLLKLFGIKKISNLTISYQEWIEIVESKAGMKLLNINSHAPLVTFILIVEKLEDSLVTLSISSLTKQSSPNWELLIGTNFSAYSAIAESYIFEDSNKQTANSLLNSVSA